MRDIQRDIRLLRTLDSSGVTTWRELLYARQLGDWQEMAEAWQRLRRAGYVTSRGDKDLTITPAGRAALARLDDAKAQLTLLTALFYGSGQPRRDTPGS
jgi:hypothetical protein